MKVLEGWEEQARGGGGGGGGMADKGAEGTGSRQVSTHAGRGKRREGGAGKKKKKLYNFYPGRKKNSVRICTRQHQKGRPKKKPKM